MDSAPHREAERLAALARYGAAAEGREAAFDDLARLAARLCGAPIGYVALLDTARQWLKGVEGIAEASLACPRDAAFCDETLANDRLTVIEDLSAHPRFASHKLVAGPDGMRFYAGQPLRTEDGHVLGTICVLDRRPRTLDAAQREGLASLATHVVDELELRRQSADLASARARLMESEARLAETHDLLSLDYATALDAMDGGVLTLGADGRITTLNRAGAEMLGLDAEAARGSTLAEILADIEGADAFVDAVLAPLAGDEAPGEPIELGARRVQLRSHAWTVRLGPMAGKRAVTAAFTDVTETVRLQAELAEQVTKLQDAYLRLERANATETRWNRRVANLRLAAIAAAVIVALGAAGWTWYGARDTGFASADAALPGGVVTITAQPQPVSARIAVVGVLEPGANVSVVGPFDGTVGERLFRYGGRVERGEVLLRMDRGEVETRLREARAAEIRARQRVEELRGWATGFEVARARRQVAAAEFELGNLRTRISQSAMLLGRGLIPADEHRTLLQQQRNQELQLQSAQQDLQATLQRGDEQNLRTAELELANAETRAREIENDLRNSEVRAPVSGVILLPPERQGQRAETIEAGSRVSRGQAMFTIGDLESFVVRGQVDEIDVNRVRPGQAVTVTGDAFPDTTLRGQVVSVASQAGGDTPGGGGFGRGMPSFGVSVAIRDLTPEQRRMLAVGMSASLSIIVHERADAVVLPAAAIRTEDGRRVVRVRDGVRTVSRPVELGITTPEGVEIRGGVAAGEVVVVRE
jgi:multidrug efflux pump subunit AcrA (membrane-fusion protein)/GAF domain-containing protein